MSSIINKTKERLLRLLSDEKSIFSVAHEIGIQYSTANKHIHTLVDCGFVTRIGEDRWKISPAGRKFLWAINEGQKELKVKKA